MATRAQTESHYQTLGVAEDASLTEINSAFRRLAREFHPDRYATAGAEERTEAEATFKRISAAYEVLRDGARREEYDRVLRGEAPPVSLDVEPARAAASSTGGAFRVHARLVLDGEASGDLPVGVTCDDPGIDLQSVSLRQPKGVPHALDVTVRGRVLEGGSRTVLLVYTAGSAVAVQWLDLRMQATVIREALRLASFSRYGGFWGWLPYAFVVLGTALLLSGGAAYAAGIRGYALGASSFAVPLLAVGLFLMVRNRLLQNVDLSSRWARGLVVGGSIAGIRVIIELFEYLF